MVALPAKKGQVNERLAPVVEFGSWLRVLREEADRTGTEIAQKLGVVPSNIYQWELGYCLPSLEGDLPKKYARLLGITVTELRQRHKEARLQVKRLKREGQTETV
jgi:DNA-binding XRE family transcriptional regulator